MKYQGFKHIPVFSILTGDTVMLHPEDQFEYRAERTREQVILHPNNPVCSQLTYSALESGRLWVKE